MDTFFYLVIAIEMITINMYTTYTCSEPKKTLFVTWMYFFVFTLVLVTVLHPFLIKQPGYGNGNGLFILLGFVYLIPLKYLFNHSLKRLLIVVCSSWIYTMFAFSLSFRIAYFLPTEWLGLSVVVIQTIFYLVTFLSFLKFVKRRFIYILENVEIKTLNLLLVLSLSSFFGSIFLNYTYVVEHSPTLELVVVLILAMNILISYKLFYSLVYYNTNVRILSDKTKRDILTRLGNREKFCEDALRKIEKEMAFTIIFIDLDNFKQVNDSYGHSVGDKYLIDFANIMKETFAKNGQCYRMSGDEFVFLSGGQENEQEIQILCEKIEKIKFQNGTCGIPFLGVSIGHSSFPADGRSLNNLLYLADLNMYQQKKIKHRK